MKWNASRFPCVFHLILQLEEMLDVVEQRDALVALLEEDRVREQEEDNNLIKLMNAKGYQLSPLSYQLGDIS